jgi:hypothetical protein
VDLFFLALGFVDIVTQTLDLNENKNKPIVSPTMLR